MSKRTSQFQLFLLFILLLPLAAQAEQAQQTAVECEADSARAAPCPQPEEDAAESEPLTQPELPMARLRFLGFLDAPQRAIASGLNATATGMDEFFAEERVYYAKTGSYLRLTVDSVWRDEGGMGYTGDIKLKLSLPRTEEKLKLTFETNPDEQRDAIDRVLQDTPSQAARERAYFAGLTTRLGKEEAWQLKPGIGIKLNRPIDLYLRLRADRTYAYNQWLIRPSQTFYVFKERGFGSDTLLELDYQLSQRLLFRSQSFVRYTDENDYYELSQVFSLVQGLTERRAIAYQAGVFGINEPTTHATDYLLQARYRQHVHAGYLFLELIPQVLYRRENAFEAEHSMTVRLEMVFEG